MLVADFPDIYSLTGRDEISRTYFFPEIIIRQLPQAEENERGTNETGKGANAEN